MQLLSAWRDSLTLFKPGNFKLFCLVTLKSLGMTYKVWLKYWGWLVGLYVVLRVMDVVPDLHFAQVVFSQPIRQLFWYGTTVVGVSVSLLAAMSVLVVVIYLSLYLSTRPSVAIKDGAYFKHYFINWHLIYVLLFLVGIALLSLGLEKLLAAHHSDVVFMGAIVIQMLLFFVAPFFILFLCDSDASLFEACKSVWRAFVMAFYNVPWCIVMAVLLWLITIGLHVAHDALAVGALGASGQYRAYGDTIIDVLFLLPLIANVATNFYIKKLHEQFGVYFK
jgi:hypothetical protein